MSTEYNDSHLGDISVDNEVIKDIALTAASEVRGIHRLRENIFSRLLNSVTRKKISPCVKLEFTGDNEVKVSLKLMADYGINIPEVATVVQENVKKAIERMTGLTVTEVVVKITAIESNSAAALDKNVQADVQEEAGEPDTSEQV